jgi:hypothetical protein
MLKEEQYVQLIRTASEDRLVAELEILGARWRWLPDWFTTELNLFPASLQEQLHALGRLHQQKTGITLNWVGTYENAARLLMHRWELEQRWKWNLKHCH